MLDQLMKLARRVGDEVEIYHERIRSTEVKYSNGMADEIQSSMLSGTALRLLKDGKVGFSYSRNSSEPERLPEFERLPELERLPEFERLIKGAVASLAAGVDGPASFSADSQVTTLDTWDPAIETVTTEMLADECHRASESLACRVGGFGGGTVGCSMSSNIHELRILTSGGADLRSRQGFVTGTPSLAYPGTGAILFRSEAAKGFHPISDGSLDFIADVHQCSQSQVSVPTGRVKVLFMPSAMFALTWRLIVGTSGRSILRKESPLAGRLDQTVAHPGITLMDDPWDVRFPGGRSFDDEGTPTKPLTLIENGVLKSYYYDRFYARKADQRPTGHGYKSAGGFLGYRLSTPPQPSLQHLTIKPGRSCFSDLVKMMDRGVIVFGPLGPHSGNIPNGDYSIGLAPGLVVEKGQIIGRAGDAMVSGNVYDTFKNVIGIGSRVEQEFMGNYPPVLFDGVSVSG
ncbi:MAG: metallopeptidase TldD-related protein [Candidatus Ozemobacteraceae bacterium]